MDITEQLREVDALYQEAEILLNQGLYKQAVLTYLDLCNTASKIKVSQDYSFYSTSKFENDYSAHLITRLADASVNQGGEIDKDNIAEIITGFSHRNAHELFEEYSSGGERVECETLAYMDSLAERIGERRMRTTYREAVQKVCFYEIIQDRLNEGLDK